jgi:hypothetical protein
MRHLHVELDLREMAVDEWPWARSREANTNSGHIEKMIVVNVKLSSEIYSNSSEWNKNQANTKVTQSSGLSKTGLPVLRSSDGA